MSGFVGRIVALFLFFINLCCSSFAGISFGSQDSTITVSSGARLNIGAPGLVVSGTVLLYPGYQSTPSGSITGNSFSFDNGLLGNGLQQQGWTEIVASGVYDPSAANVLNLVGNSAFRFEPGTIVQGISVLGTGNAISGQPLLQNPIVLFDDSTELSVGIQNALGQNILLNGGAILLTDDLSLADNVIIAGPGVIDLNNKMLSLGGYYSTVWADSLMFQNAASIVLNGDMQLSGTWTFSGESRLSGNGAILDLSSGGQIVLLPGATLYIEDVTISGLSDLLSSIVFTDTTSQLHIANSNLVLAGNFSTLTGNIFVDAISTFVLGGYNWTINSPAVLTVNTTALWLEVLSVEGNTHGQLLVPKAIYDANGYNSSNVAFDIGAGTLVLNNDAIIKQTVFSSGSQTVNPNAPLISGNVTNNFTMIQTLILNSGKVVNITGTAGVLLDGGGQSIVFNNSNGPQFIVQNTVTVTLANITLLNINQNTFNIKPGGTVAIGPNTSFEFAQDLTFSTGTFTLTDTTGSSIFTLESMTGSQTVTFTADATLDLGNNTMQLFATELDGISTISYGPAALIELTSGSFVDVDVDTGLNFLADGAGNALSLMNDNLTLSGLIAFSDAAINELAIRFVLPNGVTTGNLYPTINIAGAPGIMLGGSPANAQRLYFQDPHVILNLEDPDSFLFDRNGQLFYNTLEVLSNNIKQYSANIVVNGASYIGQIIDPSFIRAFTPFQKVSSKPAEQPSTKINAKNDKSKNNDKPKNKVADTKKRRDVQGLEEALGSEHTDDLSAALTTFDLSQDPAMFDLPEDLTTLGLPDELTTFDLPQDLTTLRAVNLPTPPYDQTIGASGPQYFNYTTTAPNGNILVENGSYAIGVFTGVNPFDFVLNGNATLSFANTPVALVAGTHFVQVVGTGNVIEVSNTLTINNNLLLDLNSELTIKFVQSGTTVPMVILSPNNELDIELNGVVRFEGSGIVQLSNGVLIKLKGTTSGRAQLILSDGATIDFVSGATAQIKGVGKISLQNGGLIKPSVTSTLIIGSSTSSGDNIDIEGVGGSSISLANSSTLSLWYLTSNIQFKNGATMSVDDSSLFEINSHGSSLKPGKIKQFSFDGHGALYVKEGGTLSLAPNSGNSKLAWYGFESIVNRINCNSQNGIIQFFNSSGLFINGVIDPSNINIYMDYYGSTNITMQKIASLLVTQNSKLTVTTYYYDPIQKKFFVITKNSVKVTLQAGDVIDSDNSVTGEIFGHNGQTSFVILANGTRQ